DPEPLSGQPGEHRISPPAMKKRHSAGGDVAAPQWQAAPLNEVEPLPHLFEELGRFPEVVAVVGIAHDYELAFGCGDAAHQGASITLFFDGNHASPHGFRYRLRSVGAAIVGDYYLADGVAASQGRIGFLNARLQSVGLVQARYHDRQFDIVRVRRSSRIEDRG